MITDMEKVMAENGIFESQQSINWARVFYSIRVISEGKPHDALCELVRTTKAYTLALDGDEFHPYLDTFYQQMGNLCYQLKDFGQAIIHLDKLLTTKELLYGYTSKHLIDTLM